MFTSWNRSVAFSKSSFARASSSRAFSSSDSLIERNSKFSFMPSARNVSRFAASVATSSPRVICSIVRLSFSSSSSVASIFASISAILACASASSSSAALTRSATPAAASITMESRSPVSASHSLCQWATFCSALALSFSTCARSLLSAILPIIKSSAGIISSTSISSFSMNSLALRNTDFISMLLSDLIVVFAVELRSNSDISLFKAFICVLSSLICVASVVDISSFCRVAT